MDLCNDNTLRTYMKRRMAGVMFCSTMQSHIHVRTYVCTFFHHLKSWMGPHWRLAALHSKARAHVHTPLRRTQLRQEFNRVPGWRLAQVHPELMKAPD